jgi:two-component system, chemotaxis family, protein-glutamate methylesterase/glutaminase
MIPASRSTRVLVVDDDPVRSKRLMEALRRDGDIVVVGHAGAPDTALTLVEQLRPAAVVFDQQLRDGGAQTGVELIMAHRPTPILVLSSTTGDCRAPWAADALGAGAVRVVPRPVPSTPDLEAELRRAVRQISRVTVVRRPPGRPAAAPASRIDCSSVRQPLVAVAASTGGPSALAILLAGLGRLAAPVLVVQHLHPDFTRGLVDWMARVSPMSVTTAQHGEVPRPGHVYVAPGGLHLRLGAHFRLDLGATPRALHTPSADELFSSVAQWAGAAGVGVLLTGMGDDGAQGLLAIHRNGGRTLAQDEESCAVFGMPRAAHRLGAVTDLLPLPKLAEAVQRAVREVLDERV